MLANRECIPALVTCIKAGGGSTRAPSAGYTSVMKIQSGAMAVRGPQTSGPTRRSHFATGGLAIGASLGCWLLGCGDDPDAASKNGTTDSAAASTTGPNNTATVMGAGGAGAAGGAGGGASGPTVSGSMGSGAASVGGVGGAGGADAGETVNGTGSGTTGGTGGGTSELPSPCGIYVMDATRDAAFLAGVMATLKWPEVETSEGVYDFTSLKPGRVGAGQRMSIRMTRGDPSYIAEGAASTWNWVVASGNEPGCEPPTGCPRAVPWDDFALTRYEAFVQALADQVVTMDGVEAELSDHPALESVMLILPGWSRVRELEFDIEDIPGYTRALLIESVVRALRAQAGAFPNKPVFTQFFPLDDGADPPLDEALRDAILSDPTLDHVGFYQENLAHSIIEGEERFRPATSLGAPLLTSKDQTFTGFQALSSWASPTSEEHVEAVQGGEPAQAMDWALETYGARYFEIYAQDVDAAVEGDHPEWVAGFEATAARLCP